MHYCSCYLVHYTTTDCHIQYWYSWDVRMKILFPDFPHKEECRIFLIHQVFIITCSRLTALCRTVFIIRFFLTPAPGNHFPIIKPTPPRLLCVMWAYVPQEVIKQLSQPCDLFIYASITI